MTEQQKLEITVGMRVMVKVAAREIPATVIEVREDCFIVRSDSTGREFRTNRVVDIIDTPEADETGIEEAAAEVAAEEDATAELRRREEEGANADGADETAEAEGEDKAEDGKADEQPKDEDAKAEEYKVEEAKAEAPAAEDGKTEAPKDEEQPKDEQQPKDEKDKADGESAKAEEPPEAEETDGEEPAADGGDTQGEAVDAKPRKNLSLVDAAIEILKAEKRPMGAKELVRLAVERGLWIPTKAKTPDQSLYGGLYLEMKNSRAPRVRKSAEKGKFELV